MKLLTQSLVLWIAMLHCVLAFKPKVKIYKLEKPVNELKYFDDSNTVVTIRDLQLSVSYDDGENWDDVKAASYVHFLEMDPFDKHRALVISPDGDIFGTDDTGKTFWAVKLEKKYNISSNPGVVFSPRGEGAIVDFYSCPNVGLCTYHVLYSSDFRSFRELDGSLGPCQYTLSNIVCIQNKVNSFGHVLESKLVLTHDHFKKVSDELHAPENLGRFIDVRAEGPFTIAVLQNDKFSSDSKVSLFVAEKDQLFVEADLKIDVPRGMLTFLPSLSGSLFVELTDRTFGLEGYALSKVYASDGSGTRFHEVIDKVESSAITKVQTLHGIWLVNTVKPDKNDDADKSLLDLLVGGGPGYDTRSMISVNDGKDWRPLEVLGDDGCKLDDGCSLHVFDPEQRDGSGKFVTGPTPGIVFAVGNTGKSLKQDFSALSSYVSRDGGSTWTKALDEGCSFSFGDLGNIILAVPYLGKGDDISVLKYYYSLDQGKTWDSDELKVPLFPTIVATHADSSAAKFILTGIVDNTPNDMTDNDWMAVVYSINFEDAFDGKKCGKGDFEEVPSRPLVDDKPVCVYGYAESFHRRKQDAQCLVRMLFEDVEVVQTKCKCTDADFVCAQGLVKEDGKCVPDDKAIADICAAGNHKSLKYPEKYVPKGNQCDAKGVKIKDVSFKCSEYTDGKKPLGVESLVTTFEGKLAQYTYIELADKLYLENIVVRTTENRAFISIDGGLSFKQVPVEENIVAYYVGFVAGQILLVTDSRVFYVSSNGGRSFMKQLAPDPPVRRSRVVSFHREDPDVFVWFGESADGSSIASVTHDGGATFDPLVRDVIDCDFVGTVLNQHADTLFCSVLDGRKLKLQTLKNYFGETKTAFDNIVGYAVTGNFVVVATVDEEKKSLRAKVTVDGTTFADAAFPPNFHVDFQQAYTVLDSQSKAIFMHVTTHTDAGFESGAILKSNSNGTSYVLSLENVNRNSVGYVDYDRIEGLDGVLLSNVVANPDGKDHKKLKSRISHNDGAEWSYIAPPRYNSKGKKYRCTGKSLEKCSLNLHGFTQRPDYRDTYLSGSAVGVLIGTGTVGQYLGSKEHSGTFLSRDGGITWKEIDSDNYMWEFGDRGTVLVLVKGHDKTDSIKYSLDDGESWKSYKFSDHKVHVDDIATSPSDTSFKFTLFAHEDDSSGTFAISIDFSKVYTRQCQFDLDNPDTDDFEYWLPKHPLLDDNCLFGHEAKYLRRARGHHDCFIGAAPIQDAYKVMKNCSCTRQDFECDYNYQRQPDNTCKLVKGLSPADRKKEECKKEGAFEYFEPTGYRRIPLSTCEGGKQFDSWNAMPCPGKQKEFNQHYGRDVGFGGALLIMVIPVAVFLFATWFVYDRGIRRNGGFKQLGQIRLDDDDDFHPIENDQVDVVVNKIVKGGIYAAAVVIAGFKTIRKVDRAILERLTSGLLGRRPGLRRYVLVPDIDEEEELFGNFQDNYDEELEDGADVNFAETDDDFADFQAEPDAVETDSRLFDIDDDEEAPLPK